MDYERTRKIVWVKSNTQLTYSSKSGGKRNLIEDDIEPIDSQHDPSPALPASSSPSTSEQPPAHLRAHQRAIIDNQPQDPQDQGDDPPFPPFREIVDEIFDDIRNDDIDSGVLAEGRGGFGCRAGVTVARSHIQQEDLDSSIDPDSEPLGDLEFDHGTGESSSFSQDPHSSDLEGGSVPGHGLNGEVKGDGDPTTLRNRARAGEWEDPDIIIEEPRTQNEVAIPDVRSL
ncbi:hypothetical protein CC1G_12027 [Coprinopsis cinerea okayama7|uniref:Uncharacterized protein n=1 Tax=Coprinopsis cinerea (strain Okayama-7 / 130 / ATCC MYA-4618 / FGSC 9003) TaxID=240176 RepID=A8P8G6_COPC7|nr:hypothetical protein CC1G_12027 [Coprinopsis cinerea okayama7\|eukprot:XP_001839564.2 hypothetical protein CC1G_12027 [Coprinopsis cinerea okayama7\